MYSTKIKLYEGRDDVTLTTYVLDDSPEMLKGRKRPAVLICPGGAYLSCSDREGEPVAMSFAAMGYHAFVLRYSTYMEGKMGFPPMNEAPQPKPQCIHPAPMRDIAKAMLYIKNRSDEWLVDNDRIAICGFSAGAHNCAMYSVYWDKPVLSEFFGEAPERFRPAATILGYTLSDYVLMKQATEMDEMAKGLFSLSNLSFMGTPEPDDDALVNISPSRLVDSATPPMFLWATSGDNLVPVAHTTAMAHALALKKIPFEVHVFEEGDHGLSLATQATAGAKDQIDANAMKWIALAQCWLEKRFAFDLPESSAWQP